MPVTNSAAEGDGPPRGDDEDSAEGEATVEAAVEPSGLASGDGAEDPLADEPAEPQPLRAVATATTPSARASR